MYIKHTNMICSVQGCKNTDTMFLSKNKITFNTPNVCRDCVKNAYLALFGECDGAAATAEKTISAQAEKPNMKQSANSAEKTTAGDTAMAMGTAMALDTVKMTADTAETLEKPLELMKNSAVTREMPLELSVNTAGKPVKKSAEKHKGKNTAELPDAADRPLEMPADRFAGKPKKSP